MIIHTMPQRSAEWHAVRLGRITATSFPTMANGQKGTIETLCRKTATERITRTSSEDHYTNGPMEAGLELEDFARRAYEMEALVHVQQVGFVELDECVGASPDGLIGEDGGCEIKCPLPHNHLKYLLAKGKGWREYRWQVQGALWVTGRQWWDFVSYCPAFPQDRQLVIERVAPDLGAFAKLQEGAAFCRQRIAELVKGFHDVQG